MFSLDVVVVAVGCVWYPTRKVLRLISMVSNGKWIEYVLSIWVMLCSMRGFKYIFLSCVRIYMWTMTMRVRGWLENIKRILLNMPPRHIKASIVFFIWLCDGDCISMYLIVSSMGIFVSWKNRRSVGREMVVSWWMPCRLVLRCPRIHVRHVIDQILRMDL